MYFDFISKVPYEGKETKNPFAFRYYDAEKEEEDFLDEENE